MQIAEARSYADACPNCERAATEADSLRAELKATKKYADEGWAWLDDALDALGVSDVFGIKEVGDQMRSLREERKQARKRIEELEGVLEPFAAKSCAKFPKERQPNRFSCLSIRADHRENAADYTDESNAEAEQLCESCQARAALSPDQDTER